MGIPTSKVSLSEKLGSVYPLSMVLSVLVGERLCRRSAGILVRDDVLVLDKRSGERMSRPVSDLVQKALHFDGG